MRNNIFITQESKNKEIILKIALSINKEMYDDNKISYKRYKSTEENILKQLRIYN